MKAMVSKRRRNALLLIILLSFCFLAAPCQSLAITINTLDFEGRPTYLSDTVSNDPEKSRTIMLDLLRKGNINAAADIARVLVKSKADDADIRAVLSLFHASIKDIETARTEYDKAVSIRKDAVTALYALALIQKNQGQFQAALETSRKAITRDASHPYPYNVTGRIHTALKQYDKAVAAYTRAIEADEAFLPAYLNLGAIHYLREESAQAEHFFRKALAIDNGSFQAHLGIGILYNETGQYAKALHHFAACDRINPHHALTVSTLASLQLRQRQFDEAQATAQRMAKMKLPGSALVLADAKLHLGDADGALKVLSQSGAATAESRYLEGFCHMSKSDPRAALNAMQKTLALDSKHTGARTAKAVLDFYLGKPASRSSGPASAEGDGAAKLNDFLNAGVAASAGNWDKAYALYQQSQGLVSGLNLEGISQADLKAALVADEFRSLNLGVLLYFKNLDRDALRELRSALEKNPNSIWANFWSAQVLLRQGKKAESREAFIQATSGAPRFYAALYAVGELYATIGDFTNAEKYYKRALDVKRDLGVLLKLGLISQNSERYEQAEQYYADMVDLSPKNYIALNQLAWFYAERGVKLNKALSLAQRAEGLNPGNVSIQDTLGWIYYMRKEYPKALKHFQSALKGNTNDPVIYYHVGKTYHALGKTLSASNAMKKALAINENFQFAADAKKHIQ